MPDVLTPAQRHRCMSHIRSKATKPERTLNKNEYNMTKRPIDIRECAGEIIRSMRPGILLTTKPGEKAKCKHRMTIQTMEYACL